MQHDFPNNIIRSKGIFWIASRPEQALIWSQAGGSLKADSAGVWWDSMPYGRRAQHLVFLQNQVQIEAGWDSDFGDRKNEIVFIGQDMNEELIKAELDTCLSTVEELDTKKWEEGYKDNWPIQRNYT